MHHTVVQHQPAVMRQIIQKIILKSIQKILLVRILNHMTQITPKYILEPLQLRTLGHTVKIMKRHIRRVMIRPIKQRMQSRGRKSILENIKLPVVHMVLTLKSIRLGLG